MALFRKLRRTADGTQNGYRTVILGDLVTFLKRYKIIYEIILVELYYTGYSLTDHKGCKQSICGVS